MKTTSPRTEAGRTLWGKREEGWERTHEEWGERIAAIEAEAAAPYRRVVEAARRVVVESPGVKVQDGDVFYRIRELKAALAALGEAERG